MNGGSGPRHGKKAGDRGHSGARVAGFHADAFSSPPDGWEPTGSVGRGETTGKLKREGQGEAETQVDRRGQTDTEGDAVPRIGTPRESGFFFLPWFSECCLGPS